MVKISRLHFGTCLAHYRLILDEELTIIPPGRVGYEMIDSQRGA